MRSFAAPSVSGCPSSARSRSPIWPGSIFGPFQIADMAGLDTYARVLETLQHELGERFFVPDMLREQLAQGRVGTKGGAGFADYTAEQRDQLHLDRDRYYAALAAFLQRESATTPAGATPRAAQM